MQRSINFFSAVLIKMFGLISNSSCAGFYGEPDYPRRIIKINIKNNFFHILH